MKKVSGVIAALLASTSGLWSATLLPNGQQQFIDANGNPYVNGRVWFYSNYPACTVLKNTYQNEAGTQLNTNPVVLDAAGRATIFGSGAYCQVLKDSSGNTIWSKYTSDTSSSSNLGWGGTSGGTANAQTVSVSSFSNVNGQTFYFVASATNTGPFTLSVNGGSAIAVVADTPAGPRVLSGSEIVTGNVVGVTYLSTTGNFHLITNNIVTAAGQLASFGSTTCPAGWLQAQGQQVAITTYASLYASIGTSWNVGGETAGNFRLPDLRGVFLRGSGTNATGSSTGAIGPSVGSYAADTYLNHNHNVTDPGHVHSITLNSNGQSTGGTAYLPGTGSSISTNSNVTNLTVNTSTTGGTETKPKNYGVLYCIKY